MRETFQSKRSANNILTFRQNIVEPLRAKCYVFNVCGANYKQFGKTFSNRCTLNVLRQTFVKRNENHLSKRNCAFHLSDSRTLCRAADINVVETF